MHTKKEPRSFNGALKNSVDKLKKQGYVIAVSDPCLNVSFLSS